MRIKKTKTQKRAIKYDATNAVKRARESETTSGKKRAITD